MSQDIKNAIELFAYLIGIMMLAIPFAYFTSASITAFVAVGFAGVLFARVQRLENELLNLRRDSMMNEEAPAGLRMSTTTYIKLALQDKHGEVPYSDEYIQQNQQKLLDELSKAAQEKYRKEDEKFGKIEKGEV